MSVPVVQVAELARRGDVVHGFSTREGGVSGGSRATLHLALKEGDPPGEIVENWTRFLGGLGLDVSELALLDQVHGAGVVEVSQPGGPLATVAVADGAVTSRTDVVLAVRTADCVPVLLAAPGAVGVAHAGWRGTVAGVVGETVRRLCALADCPATAVSAAIGPHAGAAAYEVGPDVVDALVGAGLPRDVVSHMGPGGREHANLDAAVRYQLAHEGVVEIVSVGVCTLTDPRFFSHRRDGAGTGRMAGVIARALP